MLASGWLWDPSFRGVARALSCTAARALSCSAPETFEFATMGSVVVGNGDAGDLEGDLWGDLGVG